MIREIIGGMFEITEEPCGCMACSKEIQPGHFLCNTSSKEMLELEGLGIVHRRLVGGFGSPLGPQRWAWFINTCQYDWQIIEAARFAFSPEGRKPDSGAMGQLKAAVAAYNEAQEQ